MKQYLILGAGKFGSNMAKKLYELGQEVMIMDMDNEIVQGINEYVTYAVQGDVTNEASLRELGAQNFDVVVVSIGNNIQASIMVTLLLKEMGVKKIISKAVNQLHAKVLYRIGANRVVFPEQETAIRIAQNLVTDNIFDFINLSPEHSIAEIEVKDEWIGETIIDINPRANFNINIIAIKNGVDTDITILPSRVIKEGDVLLVLGRNDDIKKIDNA